MDVSSISLTFENKEIDIHTAEFKKIGTVIISDLHLYNFIL